ncbi:K homology domain-containing protein, partial [Tanacetum coccineum]
DAWKTIRYFESESGAMIQVIRDFASDPSLTSLELTGSSDAIAKAEELIQKVLTEVYLVTCTCM